MYCATQSEHPGYLGWVLSLAVLGGCASSAVARMEAVAVTGDPVPGLAEGITFGVLGKPVLNASGQVAHISTVAGLGVDGDNDSGVWRDRELISREGDTPPGLASDVLFASFSQPVIDGAGQVAYSAGFRGEFVTEADNQSLWVDASLRVRNGDLAPETEAGVRFEDLGPPIFNRSGQLAHQSDLAWQEGVVDELNDRGIWLDGALVVRESDRAPGTPDGISFREIDTTVLSDSGQISHMSFLIGGVVPDNVWAINNGGIWDAGGLVARENDPAYGVGEGVLFSSLEGFENPSMNGAGQVAYKARLKGAGVTADNELGLWRDDVLIAREGDPATAVGTGVTFTDFGSPVINAAGQAAYHGSLSGDGVTGENDTGVWLDDALLVREGDPAPGAPAGVAFAEVSSVPIVNGRGQVVHHSRVAGPGVGGPNNRGLWLADAREQIPVVREGDLLEGKTVLVVGLADDGRGEAGRGSPLNDLGQVAFQVDFLEDMGAFDGIFVYTPELSWRETTSGQWDDADHWTLGIAPGPVHDVVIDSDVELSVTGPAADVTVRSLTVGGGEGLAMLVLQPGAALASEEPVSMGANGVLAGEGILEADVTFDEGAAVTVGVRPPVGQVPVPGVDHDRVVFAGDETALGGELRVVPLPDVGSVGGTPLGTEYEVVVYGNRSGMFERVTGAVLSTDSALAPLLRDTDAVPDGIDDAIVLRVSMPGDLNLDNRVSVSDLSTFALNFGTTPGLYNEATGETSWMLGDFNGDGSVGVSDLSLLALNFGFSLDPPVPAAGLSLDAVAAMAGIDLGAVPEPGVGVVVFFAAAGGLSRRRRRVWSV